MKKASGFEKFYKGGPKTGGAKKEEFRKEKREARKEREEKIKKAKQAKYANQPPRSRFDVSRATPEKRAEAPKYNLEPPQKRGGVKLVKKNIPASPPTNRNTTGRTMAPGKTTPAGKFTPTLKPQTATATPTPLGAH